MLEKVRRALRLTHEYHNDEVEGLIAAALADLKASGVPSGADAALVERAVITYAKAYFGYDNPEAERLDKSYEMLKRSLCIYTPFPVGEADAT